MCVFVGGGGWDSKYTPLQTVPPHVSARWGEPRAVGAPELACAHTWSGCSSEHALTATQCECTHRRQRMTSSVTDVRMHTHT